MFDGIYGVGKKSNGVGSRHRARLKDVAQGLHGGRTEQRRPAAGDTKGKMKPPFAGQRPSSNSPSVGAEEKERHFKPILSQKNIGTTKSDKKHAKSEERPLRGTIPLYSNRAEGATKPMSMRQDKEGEFLSAKELGVLWNRSAKTIAKYFRSGLLPFGQEPRPGWSAKLVDVEAFEQANPWVLDHKLAAPAKGKSEAPVKAKRLRGRIVR
jgi:hypothetical protein